MKYNKQELYDAQNAIVDMIEMWPEIGLREDDYRQIHQEINLYCRMMKTVTDKTGDVFKAYQMANKWAFDNLYSLVIERAQEHRLKATDKKWDYICSKIFED